MKRVVGIPVAVIGYVSSALYLVALCLVYSGRGRPISALLVGIIAVAVVLPVLRLDWRS